MPACRQAGNASEHLPTGRQVSYEPKLTPPKAGKQMKGGLYNVSKGF